MAECAQLDQFDEELYKVTGKCWSSSNSRLYQEAFQSMRNCTR